MEQQLIDFLMGIPATIGKFATWLTTPLYPQYINMSPLQLLGVAGVTTITALIVVHIVKLFI